MLAQLYSWLIYSFSKRIDFISEIGIDAAGRLFVRPKYESFEYIYRAAMEVRWDYDENFLVGPKPREWTHLRWYEQVLTAVKLEYGFELKIAEFTKWTNIDDALRSVILEFQRTFWQ